MSPVATVANDVEEATLKLEHLPLIRRVLKRLRIAEIIDERVPPDPRSRVTTGECLEALIVAILTSKEGHPLYRVEQLLQGYDLELGLGWTIPAGALHDQKLARDLDRLWKAGADPVVAAVFVRAVKEFAIELALWHADTTTSPVHGIYRGSRPPEDAEEPRAVPHVTKGRSKDHHGLKQVVFGLGVVNDGAIPGVGHLASGNRSDSKELRYLMRRVAERVPDPTKTTIIGDSKLFAGETFLLGQSLGFELLTLVPKTTNLRDEVLALFRESERKSPAPVLHEKLSARTGEREVWRGRSFDVVYQYEAKDGTVTPIPLHALAVHSSALATQKRPTLERRRDRERSALEKKLKRQHRLRYKCGPDTLAAAQRLEKKPLLFHRLVTRTKVEYVPAKRPRPGRPRQDEPVRKVESWSVWFEIEPIDGALERLLEDESTFVLVTTHPSTGPRAWSDPAVFRGYHDQCLVEGAHHWFKGRLDFAPIFLKTEARIAALAQVYVLALMVYALVQREARSELAQKKERIAGNIALTDRPTTEVAFRLFENVTTVRRPGRPIRIENLTTAQVHGYKVLGVDVLSRPDVEVATPRDPRPGDRGYYLPAAAAASRRRAGVDVGSPG